MANQDDIVWDAPAAPVPSKTEAGVRGAVQGASMGFGDELSAGLDHLISKVPGVRTVAEKANQLAGGSGPGLPLDDPNITYEQRRDAYRQRNDLAKQAHNVIFGASEVGGALATSLVPVGAAAKGVGLGAKVVQAAKTGAILGGVSAAGNSTADLTKGDVGGFVKDTATGSGLGAVASAGGAVVGAGISKLSEKAKIRAAKILRSYFGGGPDVGKTTETIRRKATQGGAADVLEQELAADPEAQQIALVAKSNPEKAAGLVKSRVDEILKPRTDLYGALEHTQGPIDPEDYTKFIVDEMKGLAGKNTDEGRAKLKLLQEMNDHAGNYWSDRKVPWLEMREHVTDLQSQASGTMGAIAETERKGLADWRKSVGTRFLNQELDKAAQTNPGQKAVVEAIRELNERFSAWKGVDQMLQQRITSKNANAWKDRVLGGALPGAIGATEEVGRSIAHGDDPIEVATHAAIGGTAGFGAGVIGHRVVGPAAQAIVRKAPTAALKAADLGARIFGNAYVRTGPGVEAKPATPPADDITWDQ